MDSRLQNCSLFISNVYVNTYWTLLRFTFVGIWFTHSHFVLWKCVSFDLLALSRAWWVRQAGSLSPPPLVRAGSGKADLLPCTFHRYNSINRLWRNIHTHILFFPPVNPGITVNAVQLPCSVLPTVRGSVRFPGWADHFHVTWGATSVWKSHYLENSQPCPMPAVTYRGRSRTSPRYSFRGHSPNDSPARSEAPGAA